LGTARPSFDGRFIVPGIWHEQPIAFSAIGGGELAVSHASQRTAAGPTIPLRGSLVDSCVCADNLTVAAVSVGKGNSWLALVDIPTGKSIAEPIRLPSSPRSVAARPSAPQVAVLCEDGKLLVFNTRSGELILTLDHGGSDANGRSSRVEYSADGTALVSIISPGNIVHVRDAGTGQLRYPAIQPEVMKGGGLRSFALSADSRLLATAVTGKNAAQVWDLTTGRSLSQPLQHPGDHYGLYCLCFSPDGRYLLTGSKDGQARLWDWQAATLACPPLKQDEEVLCVAISPDGRFALTAGRDRASKLHIWELTTGRLVAPKIPLPTNVNAIICSSNGSLVTSSLGFVARLDLTRLLAPPKLPIADYRLLGELASGQRIDRGDERGLTQIEWLDRLDEFNRKHPEHDRSK
jgi:WD40 repeat protein